VGAAVDCARPALVREASLAPARRTDVEVRAEDNFHVSI
jgi:hypothetical protein